VGCVVRPVAGFWGAPRSWGGGAVVRKGKPGVKGTRNTVVVGPNQDQPASVVWEGPPAKALAVTGAQPRVV